MNPAQYRLIPMVNGKQISEAVTVNYFDLLRIAHNQNMGVLSHPDMYYTCFKFYANDISTCKPIDLKDYYTVANKFFIRNFNYVSTLMVWADGSTCNPDLEHIPTDKSDDFFLVDGSTTLQQLLVHLPYKQAVDVAKEALGLI